MNRSIRTGAALAGVAGVVALAGCGAVTVGATADDETATTDASSGQATDSGTVAYADGTYTAEGSYQTPETVETVSVTVTIEDDVVTAVEVTGDPQAAESRQYQSQFIAGIADEVVGVALDDLAVDRVAGSSLTSGGFNAAIEQIKQDAAA
ncbi:FMN-binding protein [Microbacterium barkeri]|uniref:FMN-binding protein n=1 Tax=Microbacterium barkeri TaxID=33917 RepID=UPI0024AF894C|nr:FMN-binding protein [Microbacterium barkeri]MDI6944112.1 FMN-binding protein [Microbacterium barkeri]